MTPLYFKALKEITENDYFMGRLFSWAVLMAPPAALQCLLSITDRSSRPVKFVFRRHGQTVNYPRLGGREEEGRA